MAGELKGARAWNKGCRGAFSFRKPHLESAMLRRLLSSGQTIQFLCRPEDLGVIAEPRPAKSVMPEWFRKLPPVDKSQLTPTNNGQTVKRCMPFLDAMIFECVAGVVDTDAYAAHIHFPFFATAPDGLYTIEKGAALVQVIPFRRADAAVEAEIRAEDGGESRDRERVFRNTIAGAGWYRTQARAAR